MDSRYLESPEEEEEPEEEGDFDIDKQSLNQAFVWPKCAHISSVLPSSAVDGARDRVGSVGVQEVAFLPVHLSQGSALGQRHLPQRG